MNLIIKKVIFLITFMKVSANPIEYKGKCINITKSLYFLETKNGEINEEDLKKGKLDQLFKKHKKNKIHITERDKGYYLKFDIINYTNNSTLYISTWIKKEYSENFLEIKKDDLQTKDILNIENYTNYRSIPVCIKPNETKTIYLKLKRGIIVTPIYLNDFENILNLEKNRNVLLAYFVSSSLILISIILVLYFMLEKSYLLYCFLIILTTYLKTGIFLEYILQLSGISHTYMIKIYSILVPLFIICVINFICNVLRLDKKDYIIDKLNILKYISIIISIAYLFNVIGISTHRINVRYIYIVLFNLVLYLIITNFKKNKTAKFLLIGWLPMYIFRLNSLFMILTNFEYLFIDPSYIEYIELFITIFLISSAVIYEAIEYWKSKNRLAESDRLVTLINKSSNFEDAFNHLLDQFKYYIKYDNIIFFKRKIINSQEILQYQFSIPEEDSNIDYTYLNALLAEDGYKTNFVCNDVERNNTYNEILPGYKSFISLRLSAISEEDLGYLVILNKLPNSYEYNEIMEDFRHRLSLIAQNFKLREENKYEQGIMEQLAIRDHLVRLSNSEKRMTKLIDWSSYTQSILLGMFKNQIRAENFIKLAFKDQNKVTKAALKSLDFENNKNKFKNKDIFPYGVIKHWLWEFEENIKTCRNCTLSINHIIQDDYKLDGNIDLLASNIYHLTNYLNTKVKETVDKIDISVTTEIQEEKLAITCLVKGLDITEEEANKEYKDETQKIILKELNSKKDITFVNNILIIKYLFNILINRDKKKIEHLELTYNEKLDELEEDDDTDLLN